MDRFEVLRAADRAWFLAARTGEQPSEQREGCHGVLFLVLVLHGLRLLFQMR